jgi:hypothetical protein
MIRGMIALPIVSSYSLTTSNTPCTDSRTGVSSVGVKRNGEQTMQVNASASGESRFEPLADDVKVVEKLGEARNKVLSELRKCIVGMEHVID